MSMSEDVKPRIWKAISIEWRKDSLVRMVTTFKEEGLPVIELEPTMRMMKDMADALEQINKEEINSMRPGGGYSKSARISYEALEKYRKFKEGLNK